MLRSARTPMPSPGRLTGLTCVPDKSSVWQGGGIGHLGHAQGGQLQDAGAPEPLTRATVDVVEEGVEKGTEKLVTQAILYRALLIQGGVLIGALAAINALIS